jgi:uncharacterized protein
MIIKNHSGKIVITKNAKIASSFLDRLFGLLNPRNPRYLIFNTHFGIHTLFMKKAIDILVLDGNQKIVKIKESLSPYRLYFYHPKYSVVIEMPKGSIRRFELRLNDKISIE